MTLSPEVHAQASRLAFTDGRSLSSYVEICLRKALLETLTQKKD